MAWQMWGKGEAHRGVLSGNLRERYNLEDLRVDGRMILKEHGVRAWTGLFCLHFEINFVQQER